MSKREPDEQPKVYLAFSNDRDDSEREREQGERRRKRWTIGGVVSLACFIILFCFAAGLLFLFALGMSRGH